MSVAITPFLRNALLLDAAASGAVAILLLAGGGVLSPLLDLPEALLFWSGIALVPFVALLIVLARRPAAHRLILVDVVAINALWVAASFGVLLSGSVTPNLLGYGFVVMQALAVAFFAGLQVSGMRRAVLA